MLLLYLVVMENVVAYNVSHAYEQILDANRVGSEFYTLDRLKRLEDGLTDILKNPSKTMLPDDLLNAGKVIEMLGHLPSLTSAEKTQLEYCISQPPLPDPSRSGKLSGCLEVLARIKQAALGAAASSANAQIAGESANKIGEQRQALHTFWIQAAQLILLNLLLPLLTALFGYIFGSQQAQRT